MTVTAKMRSPVCVIQCIVIILHFIKMKNAYNNFIVFNSNPIKFEKKKKNPVNMPFLFSSLWWHIFRKEIKTYLNLKVRYIC